MSDARRMAVLLASASVLSPAAAFAQGDAAPSGAAAVEEVIVTAQRREERLQDVPISITAITGSDLVRQGIADTRDLNLVTPGLNFQMQGAFAQPTIRGVGTSLTSSEANVATYIDGVYLGPQVGNLFGLANVRDIQVLKGPQGTLFGRNATGGAILITTSDPEFEFSGRATASYGRYDEARASLFLNVPIASEMIAMNGVLSYERRDGYVRNITRNVREAGLDDLTARVKLLVQPTERLKFILTGSHVERSDESGSVQRPLGGNVAGRRNPALVVPTDPFVVATDVVPDQKIFDSLVSLRATYEADWGTLTSITAYKELKLKALSEGDFTSSPGVAIPAFRGHESHSQEVTYASPDGRSLSWVAGLFYYRDDTDSRIDLLIGPAATRAPLVNSLTIARAIAGFGEVTFRPSDRLRFIAGIRYNDESRELINRRNPAASAKKDWQTWTPRVSAIYEFSDSTNGYLTYSRGFKSGEFNTATLVPQGVSPEIVDAYELGLKHATPRFSANVSAFYYDYKNIQVQSFDASTGVVTLQDNAKATIYGLDADARVAVDDHWTLSAGVAWTHSEFDDFPGAQFFFPITNQPNPAYPAGVTPCPATVTVCGDYRLIGNAAGNELPRSPELTANVSLTGRYPIGAGAVEGSATISYNGGFYWGPDNRLKQDDYTLVNARLTWVAPGDRLRLSLWGRNLTDEVYQTYGNAGATGDIVTYGLPRTLGVSADFAF